MYFVKDPEGMRPEKKDLKKCGQIDKIKKQAV